MNNLLKHLGGHANVTHIDENTINYIHKKFDIKTAIDLGCGPGEMVRVMNNLGIQSVGVDGDCTLNRSIPFMCHDFCSGPLELDKTFDLCWTVEFLEHVDAKYIDNYFSVIEKCKYVFATASQSFSGHHHVNVKLLPYWLDVFKSHNYHLSEEDTLFIRNKTSMKRGFVKETGMFFIKQ